MKVILSSQLKGKILLMMELLKKEKELLKKEQQQKLLVILHDELLTIISCSFWYVFQSLAGYLSEQTWSPASSFIFIFLYLFIINLVHIVHIKSSSSYNYYYYPMVIIIYFYFYYYYSNYYYGSLQIRSMWNVLVSVYSLCKKRYYILIRFTLQLEDLCAYKQCSFCCVMCKHPTAPKTLSALLSLTCTQYYILRAQKLI